jgi:hypothetical protein
MAKDDFTQLTHDQLNHHIDLSDTVKHIRRTHLYDIIVSSEVHNYTTRVMRLTHGCHLKWDNWSDWQHSEFLQLDQYFDQGYFGNLISVANNNAVFYLLWTYTIKALDGHKKARCVCNGSSRLGLIKVLDKVYVNYIDQTSSCLPHKRG